MKTKLFFSVLFISSMAFASGGEGGGGGKGIVCPVGGKQVVSLADTFDLKKSGALDALKPADPSAIVAAAALVVDSTYPAKVFPHPFLKGEKVSLGYMIAYRYQQLDFTSEPGTLPDLPDDHIDLSKFPAGCQKIQLAIQTISAKSVRESTRVDEMTWAERGFLDLHEVLISLRGEPGADTTPIRRTVESIASQIGDPKSPVRARIMAILNARFIRTGVITDPAAEDIIQKECRGYMMDPTPQKNDDAKTLRCRKASGDIAKADRAYDRATSVKTMLRAPSHLQCEVNAAGQNPLRIAKPSTVSMDLVSGDGLPGGSSQENKFRISVDGRSTESRRSYFITQRTEREDGFRSYGTTELQAFFVTAGGKNITLSLRNFDELTQTFRGSIDFADPTLLSYPNDSWYTVSCFSGPVKMGLDLENSNPTSRQVKAAPSPVGCSSIMMADETRAQYKHDLMALAGLELKPANLKTLRRYKALEKNGGLNDDAEIEQLSRTPVVQAYMKVRVLAENPIRCVEFRGE